MSQKLSNAITSLKTEFMKKNKSSSHIHEIIPALSEQFSISEHDLHMLHKFAENNSIYTNSYEMNVLNTACKVYQGDVNNYWIDSIKLIQAMLHFILYGYYQHMR